MGAFRDRIREVLDLVSDREAQVEYQRVAPVNVATELFSQWDDWYHPDDAAFRAEFATHELAALASFAAVIDAVAAMTPHELPELAEFVSTPAWAKLRDAATVALRELG